MNPTIKKLGYIPEAIMINVPNAFFEHDGKIVGDRELAFRRYYEWMGTARDKEGEGSFYHFISSVPAVETITTVYVCFKGYVQYKAILVKFMKNEPVDLPDYKHPARDWCVTTGPVVKAPEGMVKKGFRGFQYTRELF